MVLPRFLVAAWVGGGSLALAQTPSTDAYEPAKLVAAQNLIYYVEFDGLDAHADGWRKTAAARILNETSTGAMLEDLFVQGFPKNLLENVTSAEKWKLVQHVAHAGFTMALNMGPDADNKPNGAAVFVVRKAFSNKELRPVVARILQGLSKTGVKPQGMIKSGHKIVTGQMSQGPYAWWVEETKQEDLIFVSGPPQAAEFVLDVLDGKKPSVLTHPDRVELLAQQPGIERTGLAMIGQLDPRTTIGAVLSQMKIERVTFVGGFQDDALATITRLHPNAEAKASGQSKAVFDPKGIPNIPATNLGMMVLGFQSKEILDQINKDPASPAAKFLDSLTTTLKDKTKLRLDEDVLARLGPKITAFILPTKGGAATTSAPLNALTSLLKATTMGIDNLPKVAFLIDITDSAAFGKTLDELMGLANRTLKASFAPPGEAPPDPPPGGRNRMRGPGGPSPEFRVMAGETKSYVFTVPPELSSAFPSSFRPTIRLGSKQLAIALSADLARQALEAKGSYTPPAEVAAAFGKLPAKLNWLMMADLRGSTPEILAALPGKLQSGINIMMTPTTASPTETASANTPAARRAGAFAPMEGATAAPGAAGAAPTAANPGGARPATPGTIILQVDAAKLPSAEAIRKLMFPAIYTIDEEGDTIRIMTREAFPPIPDPSIIGLIARSYLPQLKPAGPTGNADVTPQSATGTAPKPPAAPGVPTGASAKPVD